MSEKMLALGIPTYKRPDAAIKIISQAINSKIYDQIIISCNSREREIDDFLRNYDHKNITYHVHDNNVGLSLNYLQIIQLSYCKYLHVISDEDSLIESNIKELKKSLESRDESFVALSILDESNSLYKDSLDKKLGLGNFTSDTGHIGSCLINTDIWETVHFKMLEDYSIRPGAIYPTAASALISYSINPYSGNFLNPVIKMGPKHPHSVIKGKGIYGFNSRSEQFLSLLDLINETNVSTKVNAKYWLIRFFASHAFQDTKHKFNESFYKKLIFEIYPLNFFSLESKFLLSVTITFSTLIKFYRIIKSNIKDLIKMD